MSFRVWSWLLLSAACSAVAAAPVVMEAGQKGNAVRFESAMYGMYDKTSEFAIDKGVSVAMWIKPDAWKHLEGLAHNIGSLNILLRGPGGIYFWESRARNKNIPVADINRPKLPGRWSHIVFTYDQAAGKSVFYYNGRKISEWKSPGEAVKILNKNPRAKTFFMLGHKYSGLMDEVYIYNRVLTDAEAKSLAQNNAPAGAVAAYLMDDPDNPGKDSSGNNRHLTLYWGDKGKAQLKSSAAVKIADKATADLSKFVQVVKEAPADAGAIAAAAEGLEPIGSADGVRGKAAVINGINTFLQAKSSEFALDKGMTISMWIKPFKWGHLVGLAENVGSFHLLERGQGGIYFWERHRLHVTASLLWAPEKYIIPLNKWTHIAFTYDQKGHGIGYRNGKKVAEQLPGQEGKGQGIARIFNRHNNKKAKFQLGFTYNGMMDEVYVYGRVLNADEIAALADGKAPAGAAAAYLMDDPDNPGKDSSGNNRQLYAACGPQGKFAPILGYEVDAPAAAANDTLVAWTRSSMDHSFQKDQLKSVRISNAPAAELAGNEYESFQLVLTPQKALKDVTLSVSNFELNDTVCESEVREVDYVKLPTPSNIKVPKRGANVYGESVSVYPAKDTVAGWYPDPLREMPEKFDLKANESKAFFITVKSPANAPKGIYKASAKVKAADGTVLDIPLSVRVRGFSLPDNGKRSATHTANNLISIGATTDLDGYYKMLAKYYISGTHSVSSVKVKFGADNSVTLDTTQWDKEMAVAIDKYGKQVIFVPTIGLYGIPKAEDTSRVWEGVQVTAGKGIPTEEFTIKFGNYLKVLSSHLKEKGWFDRVVMALVDEPHTVDDFALGHAISKIVRKNAPGLKIMWTKWPTKEGIGAADIWCIGALQPKQIKNALARGEKIEQYPNWHMLIDRPAMDRRILGFQMYKYGLSGILHWALDNLWKNPAELVSPQMRYPDGRVIYGSGLIMYPGKNNVPQPSIRLDTTRDALDDYEYLIMLEKLAARHPDDPVAKAALQYAKTAADKLVPCYESYGEGLKTSWKDLQWELDHKVLTEYRRQIMDYIEQLVK